MLGVVATRHQAKRENNNCYILFHISSSKFSAKLSEISQTGTSVAYKSAFEGMQKWQPLRIRVVAINIVFAP